jgi:crotonobetainyl-CoA:carnitine CoA-transferase CaiB-like acyl-CoA transferase
MDKAFAGLKVVDFSTTIAGPHCARLLADLGADVIKIESPEGDVLRTRPPMRDGHSTSFGQLNVGKRSVVLDLKSPEAMAAIRTLIRQADVLVENFRPGVMQRLGLDYASLAADNPRLIYCAISGYGQTGPSSQLPAYAPVVHAASGYDIAHLRYQGRERPDYCGVFFADVGAGTYAFAAIAAALHQRHATGRGQMLDVSMLETMLGYTLTELQAAQFHVPPMTRPMFGPIQCSDGYLMVAVVSEKTFQGFAHASGHPEWLTDPRTARYAERRTHWAEVIERVEHWSGKRTMAECQAEFERHGVPCSPYRTVAQAMADPQVAHRQALADVHDEAGHFKVLNPPFRMSASDTNAGPRAPSLGEHTAQVLREAGLDEAAIGRLAPGA